MAAPRPPASAAPPVRPRRACQTGSALRPARTPLPPGTAGGRRTRRLVWLLCLLSAHIDLQGAVAAPVDLPAATMADRAARIADAPPVVTSAGEPLVGVIANVKLSIVGIGSYKKNRNPSLRFIGTGFVVGDGLTILTSAHVIEHIQGADTKNDKGDKETIGVLIDLGASTQFRGAAVVKLDTEHDLARLRIGGDALPALALGDSAQVKEGQAMAFTGFPLGMVLGLHHVTHRAMVSSITPVIMPAASAAKLGAKQLTQLQQPAYAVFQLDASAYPGSSGSPLYDATSGTVYGVVNMVYIVNRKDSAPATPSGITYAIPANFVRELMLGPSP